MNELLCGHCGYPRGSHVVGSLRCLARDEKTGEPLGVRQTRFAPRPLKIEILAFDEAEKVEFPFRIGGIYRQNNGELRMVCEPMRNWSPDLIEVKTINRDGKPLWGDGARVRTTGLYPGERGNPRGPHHLIHGEVNAKGEPLPVRSIGGGWNSPEEYLKACEGMLGEITQLPRRTRLLEAVAAANIERDADPSARRDREHKPMPRCIPAPFDTFGKDFVVERSHNGPPEPKQPKHALQRSANLDGLGAKW